MNSAPGMPGHGVDGELARAFFATLPDAVTVPLGLALSRASAANDPKAAYDAYTECVTIAPAYFASYLLRAEVAARVGALDVAREDVDRASALEPRSHLGMILDAELRFAGGDADGAIATITRAIELASTAAVLASRAGYHERQGNLEAALVDYTAASANAPDDHYHFYNRGNLRFRLGDVVGAWSDFDAAVKLCPTDYSAILNRAMMSIYREEPRAAFNDYTLAIRVQPLDPKAYLKRGALALEVLGVPEQAFIDGFVANALTSTLASAMTDEIEMAQGIMADALDAAAPRSLVEVVLPSVLELVDQFTVAGAYGAAMALIDALEAEVPEARTHLATIRGGTYELAGDRHAALEQYLVAVEDAPDPNAWERLVELSVDLAPDEARTRTLAAIELHPRSAILQFRSAVQLAATNDLRAALDAVDRCIALDPGIAEAHFNRAIWLSQLGRTDEAIAELEATGARGLQASIGFYGLGIELQRAGRYDEALAATRRSIELAPDVANAHYSLACTLALAGQGDAALTSIGDALRLQPSLKAQIRADADFASLQRDANFVALVG